ncbi:MAG: hypothetical protein HY821_18075 [Acidobacteria bacterium]|nr:hypothetical protein [Acidobacteriota bacterium]
MKTMRILAGTVLAAGLVLGQVPVGQGVSGGVARGVPGAVVPITPDYQQDAQRTKEQLDQLLDRTAPTMREVLILDPSLISNEAYLAPYPALAAFMHVHPEIARNPAYFLGERHQEHRDPRERAEERAADMWGAMMGGMAALIGLAMAFGLLSWLIRTFIDYRRWSRLSKVQTDVHTKLMDRFGANEDLLAYIKSPAGGKFLELAPITLDSGQKSVGAPLGRILWSIQGGVVLLAAGTGLWIIGHHVGYQAAQGVQALGMLAIALGVGFVASAIISYGVARRMGLIEPTEKKETAGA